MRVFIFLSVLGSSDPKNLIEILFTLVQSDPLAQNLQGLTLSGLIPIENFYGARGLVTLEKN